MLSRREQNMLTSTFSHTLTPRSCPASPESFNKLTSHADLAVLPESRLKLSLHKFSQHRAVCCLIAKVEVHTGTLCFSPFCVVIAN